MALRAMCKYSTLLTICHFLQELGLPLTAPIHIHCDNMQMISNLQDTSHHPHTVRAILMTKPQSEISQRLGADKGQYPTGPVAILSL